MALNTWPPVWQAVALLAVDPSGLGGLVLRGGAGPERDAVLAGLRAALPAGTPWRRMPVRVDEQRLSGGLDLGLSLAAGRPVQTAGLLAEAAGGVIVLPMAERMEAGLAARLVAAMEAAPGLEAASESKAESVSASMSVSTSLSLPASESRPRQSLALVALDEGQGEDERLPTSLQERLGLMATLDGAAGGSIGAMPSGLGPDLASASTLGPASVSGSGSGSGSGGSSRSRSRGGSSSGSGIASSASDMGPLIADARARLAHIPCDIEVIEALCVTAAALGLHSMRTVWQAWAAARAAAALSGRTSVEQADAELAARLVLAPRARALPSGAQTGDGTAPGASSVASESDANSKTAAGDSSKGRDPSAPDAAASSASTDTRAGTDGDGEHDAAADHADALNTGAAADERADASSSQSLDRHAAIDQQAASQNRELQTCTLAAAKAAIPAGLLQSLCGGSAGGGGPGGRGAGRSRAPTRAHTSGRPLASRRGTLSDGRRLDLVATLRAAVPWQRLRQQERDHQGLPPPATRLLLRREDVHLKRFQRPQETTTLFVVDASGSQALNRLAEAKGAVELLLADCYVRRDRVALLAFRGHSAELLLTPTRSLARARRALASLPGGGGTPLAAGIEAAWLLGRRVQLREGGRVVLVFLTDARANVALDGSPGRDKAVQDALTTARRLRLDGLQSLLIDTAPRPLPTAMMLAQAMGARYVPLPHGQAAEVYAAVSAAVSPAT